MRKRILFGLVSFILFIVLNIPIGAKELIVNDLGIVKQYTVSDSEGSAMLSRDGNQAKPVLTNTMIKQPGTYFLTQEDKNKQLQIIKFRINASKDQNEWEIGTTKELPEIFKYSLENYKKTITIRFKNGTYTIDELDQMIHSMLEDLMAEYPRLSYVSYKMTSYGTVHPKVVMTFDYALDNIKLLKTYNENLDRLLMDAIETCIKPDMKAIEREIALTDYLASHITYAQRDTNITHTVMGAMVDGIGVCDGYAKSIMYLLNSVGVPTLFITGTADGGPHAWNLVKIDGSYYHLDLTWADSDESRIGTFYNYLNETDDYMRLTHVWNTKKYPKAENNKYTSMMLPVVQPGVYKVNTKAEWNKLVKTLEEDDLEEVNIIFNNLEENKWSAQKLINTIVEKENSNINYYTYYKYNSLIVNYALSH
ncbi:MAG: transglutaminase domain-containing protein [Longicatena sp.]